MAQPFDLRESEPWRANRVRSQTISRHRRQPLAHSRSPPSPPLPTACWCGAATPCPLSLHCSGSIAAARDSASSERPQTTPTRLSHRTIPNWPSASAIRRQRPATSGSFDLLRGTKTRLTFDPADDLDSIWSPDGTRIAFTSDRTGQRNIYWKPADGSGSEELLLGGKEGQENVEDWSRDGKYLMYNYAARSNSSSISMCCLSRRPEARAVPEHGIPHPAGSILSQWPVGRLSLDGIRKAGSLCPGLHAGLIAAARQMAGLRSRRGNTQMASRRQRTVLRVQQRLLRCGREDRRPVLRSRYPQAPLRSSTVFSNTGGGQPICGHPGTASGSWSSARSRRPPAAPIEVLVNWR